MHFCDQPRRWRTAFIWATMMLLAACGGGGGGTTSPSSPDVGAAPELVAVGSSARSTSLQWTHSAGASGYRLERRVAGDAAWQAVASLPAEADQFVDDGLAARTRYDYRLTPQGNAAAAAERSATTSGELPVMTPGGAALGEPSVHSLGAGGGTVRSADGRLVLEMPAGALPDASHARVQSVANPVPDGLGDGKRVRLSGAPARPLRLRIGYDASNDAHVDGLGVAVRRADGSWLSAPIAAVDKAERMLVIDLPPGLLAAPAGVAAAAAVELEFDVVTYLDFYLAPRQATVEAGKTLLLVPYAHTLVAIGRSCQPEEDGSCLWLPVLDTREVPFENHKAGYTRRWFVFAEENGSPALGTLAPRATAGAVYHAPARAPEPNPVTITFQSRHDRSGRTVTLTASVKVKEPVWTGILHGTLTAPGGDIGFALSAEAVWTLAEGSDGSLFHADGTQGVSVIEFTCTGSASPASAPLPPGALRIDRSVEPARYSLDVGSLWATVISAQCPGHGSGSVGMQVPGRLQVEGTLTGNGTKIEGNGTFNGVVWDWSLTSEL